MKNNKNIIKFMSAQTISLFGSSLVQYAIIWYITLHTQSGFMLSIATICGFLPQICITLFAGVWVDRYAKKWMCILPDASTAFATLLVMLCFLAGYESMTLLFVVLAIRSFMSGIQMPAVNAIIPELSEKEQLMKVNGIYGTITSLMNFLAPALSGLLFATLPFEYLFSIDILTAVIGIGIMLTLPMKHHKQEVKHTSIRLDMMATLRYLQKHPIFIGLLVFMFLVCFFISPAAFLTPLMITRNFGSDVWLLTASEMTFSLGAVAGGVLISSFGDKKRHSITLVMASILYGSMMIGLGFSPIFLIYLAFNFMIGISMPCFSTPSMVLIQEKVEPQMHGRFFSFVQLANSSALPLGTAIFGPLADVLPVQTLFVICGGIVVVLSVIAFLVLGRKSTKQTLVS